MRSSMVPLLQGGLTGNYSLALCVDESFFLLANTLYDVIVMRRTME